MSVIGEVVCLGARCYQWTIDDFLPKVWGKPCAMSPIFDYMGHKYFLILRNKKNINVFGIYFGRTSSMPRLRVRLGMNTGNKGRRENLCGETDDCGHVGVWMPYSELIERRSEILSNGELTVFCELTSLDPDESPATLEDKHSTGEEDQGESDSVDAATVSQLKMLKKLQNDLKNLLENREDCDVTIKVNGKEFLAHRSILRARSPVFNSMFSHEMAENLSGVVVIDDCDPMAFPDFLNYLYTRCSQHIRDENVCQLYTASDKYQVEELKEECAAYMKNHLSISNFCDILALALRHSEKELIDLSTEFFCSNATDIAKTATWQTFLRENSTAGNELFLKSLSRKIM